MAKRMTVVFVPVPINHLYVVAAELRKASMRATDRADIHDQLGDYDARKIALEEREVIEKLLGEVCKEARRVGENV